jgi:hypothetical protein
MVNLSVSVMAHPVRRPLVEQLLEQLGDVPVSWDKHAEPSTDPRRRWATGRAAFELADPDSDWHVVVQDDAIVSDRFVEGLASALKNVPYGAVVSCYLGTGRPAQTKATQGVARAEKAGVPWVVLDEIKWGVGIAVPTATIPAMLEWCDGQPTMPYDARIGRYYASQLGWQAWYTWPCLVDHRQGPSICGHGSSGRFAHGFAEDATVPDWSLLPPSESGEARAFRNSQTGRLLITRDPVTASQMARARRWVEEDATTLTLASHALR